MPKLKSLLLMSALLSNLVLGGLGCNACQADLEFTVPARGAMISGADAVDLVVDSSASELSINGQSFNQPQDGKFSSTAPAVEGLGFAVAQTGERKAVRAWQQGTFDSATDPIDDSLWLSIGEQALNNGQASLAALIARLLQDAELSGFVDGEMILDDVFASSMRINVLSARSPQVEVALGLARDQLTFTATFHQLGVLYSTCSDGYVSTGELRFAALKIDGNMRLSPQGGATSDLLVTLGEMQVFDDGGLPDSVLQQALALLSDNISAQIQAAVSHAAPIVGARLLAQLTPGVGVDLRRPISSQTTLLAIDIQPEQMLLRYSSQVQAGTPDVAKDNQGRLQVAAIESAPVDAGMHVVTGAALLNQILYAAWDAGNLTGLTISHQALLDAGMAELDFPYDQLSEVRTQLLLPPLLKWRDDGPILAMGGVAMQIKAEGSDDSQAWTALDLPVQLSLREGALFLGPDTSRPVQLKDVQFQALNDFANPAEVERLMQSAMPLALKLVFAQFPALKLAPYSLQRVDGSPAFDLSPRLVGVQSESGAWSLELDFTVLAPGSISTSDGRDAGVTEAGTEDAGTSLSDAACVSNSPTVLNVSNPSRGLVVDGFNAVPLELSSDASEVRVNDEVHPLSEGSLSLNLPAAQGLGFVEVVAGATRAVRSWLQGETTGADQVIDDSVAIHVGSAAISGAQNSLASLLAQMLKATDLANTLDNPIALSGDLPVAIDTYVTSAKASAVNVQLSQSADGLALNAQLLDVHADYQTHSPCVQVSGQVRYAEIQLSGNIFLNQAGASLLNPNLSLSPAQLSGGDGIPPEIIAELLQSSQQAIEQAIIAAAQQAAQSLSRELLASLLPVVNLDFPKPIEQASGLQSLDQDSTGLSLTYGVRVNATSPVAADASQGIILVDAEPATNDDPQMSLRLTGRLLNPLAFALWDAGNFSDLRFTQAELLSLGMPSLAFPYNILDEVQIKTLLPPILRWDNGQAWLDLGGIELQILAASVGDTRAWTAASVPIKLVKVGPDLRLAVDSARHSQIRSVEFEQLNPLAQESQVLSLLDTAAPAVVAAVFADLPLITMPEFTLALPDGSTGPTVSPQLLAISRRDSGWDLSLGLRSSIPPQEAPDAIIPDPISGSCTSSLAGELRIDEPSRGQQFAGSDPTAMRIFSSFESIFVDGQSFNPDDQGEVNLDIGAGDGLVFVAASAGRRHTVRAWQQGQFVPSTDWQTQTLAMDLGAEPLTQGPASLAALSASLLSNAELAPFVDNPILSTVQISVPFVGSVPLNISTTITAAHSPNVDVEIQPMGDHLQLTATLNNLIADYDATASGTGGFNSTGTVSYSEMVIQGELLIDGSSASLINAQVITASDPVIVDSGEMPAAAVSVVLAAMDGEIRAAMVQAAVNATSQVATDLISQLRPNFGADFDPPIDQDSRIDNSEVHETGLSLEYATLIKAQVPSVAASSDGVLLRSVASTLPNGNDLRAQFGSPLVNQIAFAAWDAGNFSDLQMSREDLDSAGLASLAFPYSLLQGVTLNLLLSPLLEWRADGPWLDLGGIEVHIHCTGVEDTVVWTSVQMPVRLQARVDQQSLLLVLDENRQVNLRAVEIADLNPFAQVDDVEQLIQSAVPAVIEAAFDEVPALHLPSFNIRDLDNQPGPQIKVLLQSQEVLSDAWVLHLLLALAE